MGTILTAIKFVLLVSGITKLIEKYTDYCRAKREGIMEERLASQERELRLVYDQEQAATELRGWLHDPATRREWLRSKATGPESEQ